VQQQIDNERAWLENEKKSGDTQTHKGDAEATVKKKTKKQKAEKVCVHVLLSH
jgi:hypothetical protein